MLAGGVRRGSDIAKALALGVRTVLVGRSTLHGLAIAGQKTGAEVRWIFFVTDQTEACLSSAVGVSTSSTPRFWRVIHLNILHGDILRAGPNVANPLIIGPCGIRRSF
jgi:hypothetical protein